MLTGLVVAGSWGGLCSLGAANVRFPPVWQGRPPGLPPPTEDCSACKCESRVRALEQRANRQQKKGSKKPHSTRLNVEREYGSARSWRCSWAACTSLLGGSPACLKPHAQTTGCRCGQQLQPRGGAGREGRGRGKGEGGGSRGTWRQCKTGNRRVREGGAQEDGVCGGAPLVPG